MVIDRPGPESRGLVPRVRGTAPWTNPKDLLRPVGAIRGPSSDPGPGAVAPGSEDGPQPTQGTSRAQVASLVRIASRQRVERMPGPFRQGEGDGASLGGRGEAGEEHLDGGAAVVDAGAGLGVALDGVNQVGDDQAV